MKMTTESREERVEGLESTVDGMRKPSTLDLRPSTSGFSLVEIVIAMGIAAFCLVAIFGLIPAGLKTNKESLSETMAAGLASRIAADLRGTPTALTNASGNSSFLYAIPIPVPGGTSTRTSFFLKEDGSTNSVTTLGVNYRATVLITPPAAGSRTADTASILITWPALADPNPTVFPPTNFTGSFGTVIGLDRN